MAMEVKSQVNFLRGLNLATGKATVIPGTVVRNSNMLYTKRGSLVTTDGTQLYSGFPTLDTLETIFLGTIPYGPVGPIPIALVSDDSVVSVPGQRYGPYLYDISYNPAVLGIGGSGTQPWTPAPFGLVTPQVIAANNNAVFLFGNTIPPRYYDFYLNAPAGGANVGANGPTAIGTSQGPIVLGGAHGAFHQNRLFIWNTYPYQNGSDGPCVLRACDLTLFPNLSVFPALEIANVDPNDGQEGMGCISFTSSEQGIAPTATLVLFKNYATYQYTGSGNFTDGTFAITRAQTDMGCVAPRTIQFVPGLGVVRLTHFGVAVFDGVGDTLISEEIRPYIFQSDPEIMPIDWDSVQGAQACVTVNPPMYVLAVPVIGQSSNLIPFPQLTRLLCYDMVLKAWSVIDLPPKNSANFQGIGAIGTIKTNRSVPVTLMGDSPSAGPVEFTVVANAAGGSFGAGTYAFAVSTYPVDWSEESAPAFESGLSAIQKLTVGGATNKFTFTITNGPALAASIYIYIAGPGAPPFVFANAASTNLSPVGSYPSNPLTVTSYGTTNARTPLNALGIRQWLTGAETWDGAPINWRARLPDSFGKAPSSRMMFRRCVFRGRLSVSQLTNTNLVAARTPNLTANVRIGGDRLSVSITKRAAPLNQGARYWFSRYDSSARYGDAIPDLSVPFDVGVTGNSASVEYSGNGPAEILSNDWHFVPRPDGGITRIS